MGCMAQGRYNVHLEEKGRMKAITFVGRHHHTQKLWSIIDALNHKGHTALLLTADNSINLDANTEHLIGDGLPFIHVLDYLTPEDYKQIDLLTQQTLETIRRNGQEASLSEDAQVAIEPFWWVHSAREACQSIVGFRNVIKQEKPDIVMALHSNNFWGRMWLYCGEEAGLPTIAFQEGMLRVRDQKTSGKQRLAQDHASRLFVWSDNAKKQYMIAGVPEEKIVVTGQAHLDHWLGVKDNPEWHKQARAELGVGANQKLVTFAMPLLSRFEGNPQEALNVVRDWAVGKPHRVLLKLHPFDGLESESKIKELYPELMVRRTGEASPYMLLSSMVLTQHSTVAIEALAFDKPVVELDMGSGVLEAKSAEGVAFMVKKNQMDKLDKILSGELKLDADVLEAWKAENLGSLDGHSVDRVVREIEGLLQ